MDVLLKQQGGLQGVHVSKLNLLIAGRLKVRKGMPPKSWR